MAEATADGYVGDLAVLVHKLRDMENLNVLFVLTRMENRVFLVGRSRIEEVDVGEIAREFGGGGHPTAASATIKELTLFQVRERLLALLQERVKPRGDRKRVREFMSYPAITLQGTDTVERAGALLSRYSINSFPVMDGQLSQRDHRPFRHRRRHPSRDERDVPVRNHEHRLHDPRPGRYR